MPELPEVETLRRALLPLVRNRTIVDLKFFRGDLRFPIPVKTLQHEMPGRVVLDVRRVGKYLLLENEAGALLLHLGMSGRVVQRPAMTPKEKHTHAVLHFEPEVYLHFIDPRRFGCILWVPAGAGHPLLDPLGVDPFSPQATASYFKAMAKSCPGPIKAFLMNAKRIAGVGNIYACEALFDAGIHPHAPARKLSLPKWERLLLSLRQTLERSIASGGTTLRDFFSADGTPGYFAIELSVYGREGAPCPRCQSPIVRKMDTNRSTFFCKVCQKR